MKKNKRKRWRRTSPLAALFFFGQIFRFITQNAIQSLAPLVAFVAATEGDLLTRIGLAALAVFTIPLAISVLSYWFFRYRITDDSVLIREGIFKKKQLDIKFDRIQAINTKQNLIYRHFDLVTATFDTAGSAKQEGNLPAIRTELANSLRERIRRDRNEVIEDAEADEAADSSRQVLSLNNADMIRIGLSDNRALIFLALLGPLMDQLNQRIETLVETGAFNLITGGAEVNLATGTIIAVTVGLGIILLLMIASILGAFLRYHRFTLFTDDEVLRSTGGLLTRHEHSTNLKKVQTFEARQNPILRLFRRFRLRAKQASSGKPGQEKHFVVPLCDEYQVAALGHEVFRDEFSSIEMRPEWDGFRPISSRYFRSRLLLSGILPTALSLSLLYPLLGNAALIVLAWIPLVAVAAWMKYRRYGWYADEDGFILRRGFIGARTNAFLHRKVQRVSVTQSLMQRRRGLATVRFYLASGSLRVPYVDYDLARRIRDFTLYRVESSTLAWH